MRVSKMLASALATLALVACGQSDKPAQKATIVVQGQVQALTADAPAISSVAVTVDGAPVQGSPFAVTSGHFGPVTATVAPGTHKVDASATEGGATFTATATLTATVAGPNSAMLYLVDTRYQQGAHVVPVVQAVGASPSTLVVTSGSAAATSVLASTTIFETGATKKYLWQDSCNGTFDDATAASPTYTPPAFNGQNTVQCTLTFTATAVTPDGDVSDPVYSMGRQDVTVTYVTPLQLSGYVVTAPLFDSASLLFPGSSATATCALDWLSGSGVPHVALSADPCDAQLFGSADPSGRPIVMQAVFAAPSAPAGAVAVSAKGSVTCGEHGTGELAGSVEDGVASFTWNAADVAADTACNAVLTVTFTGPEGSSPSSVSSSLPLSFRLHPAKAQGFELNATAGWTGGNGISAVASGSGLAPAASTGDFYAEIQSKQDDYDTGYGDAGYSFFGGKGTTYQGDFYQAIDVYVDAAWAPGANPSVPGFYIDMAPYHADPLNYGAEHNFRITATGTQVDVRVDGEATPLASLTASGWYTFLMTFRKDADPESPVITDMVILDATGAQVAKTTVTAVSPGGPFPSKDLRGSGYVWITVWQNGFANDVVAVDNLRTAVLPY